MGAIQVTELLHKSLTTNTQRSLEACWDTQYGARNTMCHVRPAISCDPKDRKISFLIKADLGNKQCREIGEQLVWLAEQMHDFKDPIRPNERKVVGRAWYVDSLAERKYDRDGKKLSSRMAFTTPLEKGNPSVWYVRATCWADLTPHQARAMGAYMISLSAQI